MKRLFLVLSLSVASLSHLGFSSPCSLSFSRGNDGEEKPRASTLIGKILLARLETDALMFLRGHTVSATRTYSVNLGVKDPREDGDEEQDTYSVWKQRSQSLAAAVNEWQDQAKVGLMKARAISITVFAETTLATMDKFIDAVVAGSFSNEYFNGGFGMEFEPSIGVPESFPTRITALSDLDDQYTQRFGRLKENQSYWFIVNLTIPEIKFENEPATREDLIEPFEEWKRSVKKINDDTYANIQTAFANANAPQSSIWRFTRPMLPGLRKLVWLAPERLVRDESRMNEVRFNCTLKDFRNLLGYWITRDSVPEFLFMDVPKG